MTFKTQRYALRASRDQLRTQATRLENLARHNENQREQKLLERLAKKVQAVVTDLDKLPFMAGEEEKG